MAEVECKRCLEGNGPPEKRLADVMGDGSCPVHGRFAFCERPINSVPWCPRCAIEQNICQACGGKLNE